MSKSDNTFENTLKEIRISKNLSQENMANMLNISRSAYTKYETGDSSPNVQTIKEICEILKISADYLLGVNKEKIINKENTTKNPFNVTELYMYFNAYSKIDNTFNLGEYKLVIHNVEDKYLVDFCDMNNKIYERGYIYSDNCVAFLIMENYNPNNPRLEVSEIIINISDGIKETYFGTYLGTNGEYIPSIRKCLFSTKRLHNKDDILTNLKITELEKNKLEETHALYLNIFNKEYNEN